ASPAALPGELMVVNTHPAIKRRAYKLLHWLGCVLPFSLLMTTGCTWDRWNLLTPKAPPGAADSMVLRGEHLDEETPPKPGTAAADLSGAQSLYRDGDYKQAEK